MRVIITKGVLGWEYEILLTFEDVMNKPWRGLETVDLIKTRNGYYWKTRGHNYRGEILEYYGDEDYEDWYILATAIINKNKVEQLKMPVEYERLEKIMEEINKDRDWRELVEAIKDFLKQLH